MAGSDLKLWNLTDQFLCTNIPQIIIFVIVSRNMLRVRKIGTPYGHNDCDAGGDDFARGIRLSAHYGKIDRFYTVCSVPRCRVFSWVLKECQWTFKAFLA